MRDVTERPEALKAGTTRLGGTDTTRIVDELSQLLDDASACRAVSLRAKPYDDGPAVGRIVAALMGRAVAEFATDRDYPARAALRTLIATGRGSGGRGPQILLLRFASHKTNRSNLARFACPPVQSCLVCDELRKLSMKFVVSADRL